MLTHGGARPDAGHASSTLSDVETRTEASDVRMIEYCLVIPDNPFLRHATDRAFVPRGKHA